MKRHLKRYTAPRTWKISRKKETWTIRPHPGGHEFSKSIPLGLLVRDYLELTRTTREARRLIGQGDIKVDGKIARDYKKPVGFMDVISVDKLEQHYRVLFDLKGKINLVEIPTKNAEWKLCRVQDKRNIKGGHIQLSLHDGRNIVVNRELYKPGDALKIKLPEQKILDHFPAKENFLAMVIGGKHVGQIATIDSVEVMKSSQPNRVHFKEGFSTTYDYTFVIGTKVPETKIAGVSA